MRRVLVAEDDTFLAQSYKMGLEKDGYTVEIANDGNEVLEKVEEFKPDVIILDILMPNKNGIDTLKHLKKDNKTAKIPVIVATNVDDRDTQDKCMEYGANEYITKANISISEILEKCKKYAA